MIECWYVREIQKKDQMPVVSGLAVESAELIRVHSDKNSHIDSFACLISSETIEQNGRCVILLSDLQPCRCSSDLETRSKDWKQSRQKKRNEEKVEEHCENSFLSHHPDQTHRNAIFTHICHFKYSIRVCKPRARINKQRNTIQC